MISVLNAIAQEIAGRDDLPSHVCLFYRKEGYSVGDVEFDLILDEHHSKDAEVTENPLQDGRAVSDGIYLKLRDGELTGLVSNHSLKHTEELEEENQTSEGILSLAQWRPLKNRAKQVWEDLKAIMDKKELVTIVTCLEVYENVAITHIETDRNGDSGDALEIKCTFKQIKKVKLSEDNVSLAMQPEDMNTDINRASALNIDSGQTVGTKITEAEREQLFLGVQ